MWRVAVVLCAGIGVFRVPAFASDESLGTCERASAAWTRWDADRSGRVSPAEALAGGVEARLFEQADADGDGTWSRCEFVLQYAQRCRSSGVRVAADLEAEIVRIQALRKARRILEGRRVAGEDGPAAARLAQARATLASTALAELQAHAARGTVTRESVGRARSLLAAHADLRSRNALSPQKERELAAWTEVQRELARVEHGVRAPHEARGAVEGLRRALVRHGWLELPASR